MYAYSRDRAHATAARGKLSGRRRSAALGGTPRLELPPLGMEAWAWLVGLLVASVLYSGR